ncbi:hypothetical protein ACFOVU_14470 [Nocardiopsis sediminis]|uniref:Uncharacterized protein n=1 Tax=Nocardiopsis sediminis TaxID=1778267 RepID=A0ABV8FLX4_9ACTN
MHAILAVLIIVLGSALASMVALLVCYAARQTWSESAIMASRTFAGVVGVVTALAGFLLLAL